MKFGVEIRSEISHGNPRLGRARYETIARAGEEVIRDLSKQRLGRFEFGVWECPTLELRNSKPKTPPGTPAEPRSPYPETLNTKNLEILNPETLNPETLHPETQKSLSRVKGQVRASRKDSKIPSPADALADLCERGVIEFYRVFC